MGPKAKGGAAKKAENEKIKAAEEAAKKEAQEAASWDKGAKGKGAAEKKAEKAAEEARKKAEKERLKAEDEASLPDKPVKASGGAKKAGAKKESKPAFNGPPGSDGIDGAIQTFNADNIDDALDALDLTTERTDKAALGSKAAAIESHPERRFKAAFEAFKEREMPRARQDHPGLRTNQYHDVLYKEFQKHPDNPFNQVSVAYNADKETKLAVLQKQREEKEKRLT